MTALISEQHYARVRTFKQLLSSFQRNRDLVSVGAYAKGSDPMPQSHRPVAAAGGDSGNRAFLNAVAREASLQGLVILPTVS
ncbi:hypothetical protein ACLBR5_15090 [Escherichia coli]